MTTLKAVQITIPDAAVVLTAAQVFNGIISQTATATRIVTLPSAADLIGEAGNVNVSDTFSLIVINHAPLTTLAVPASGTLSTMWSSIGLGRRQFYIRIDNVTPGSEAYTVFDLESA